MEDCILFKLLNSSLGHWMHTSKCKWSHYFLISILKYRNWRISQNNSEFNFNNFFLYLLLWLSEKEREKGRNEFRLRFVWQRKVMKTILFFYFFINKSDNNDKKRNIWIRCCFIFAWLIFLFFFYLSILSASNRDV